MQVARRCSSIVSVGSTILLWVVAYSFDNLVHGLRHNSTLDGGVYFKLVLLSLWVMPILFLVLANWSLLLFWFVMYQGKHNIVTHVFFVAIGLCMLFIPPLSHSGWWFAPVPYFMDWVGRDRWFLLGTSTFVAAIGVMGIGFPKQKIRLSHPM